jgi:CRP-like cAMP-binding protein
VDYLPADLRRVVAFSHGSDDELNQVLRASVLRAVEEEEYFFLQGDPAEHAFVLVKGQTKLLQSNPAGQVVNLRTVYPWQLFGALGSVRQEAEYPASAQALEDSSALAIPSEFLRELLLTHPHLSMDLMDLMTSYIQEMQSRYRELATERVEQRICRTVLRLANQSGQKVEDSIELALSREDLAEMSGTTLHTVSRVLSDWDRRGIVDAGRERVKILRPHELVRMADGIA